VRSKGKIVLWPMYFDLDLSSRQGRDVPKNLAVRGIKTEEIYKAAVDLGYEAELNDQATHPRRPWERGGAALIAKRASKREILLKTARRIKENRE